MPELSDRELRWGYWYFLHRQALRRAVVIAIVLLTCAVWVYGGWQAVEWFSSQRADQEAMHLLVTSTVNTQDYFKRHAALPLEVGTATAVPVGHGLYDLLAEVRNPNPTWAVQSLSYTFSVGTESVTGQNFFLPLEDKYLVSLGVKLAVVPEQVSLSLSTVAWQRLRDLSSFSAPAFSVSNQHLDQLPPPSPGAAAPTRLRFDLTNDSALSFWQVAVTVVLAAGANPQAVGRQLISDVASGGTYPVELVWPNGAPPSNHLVVKTEVNVLDPSVIKPAP